MFNGITLAELSVHKGRSTTPEELLNLTNWETRAFYMDTYWTPLWCGTLGAGIDLMVLDGAAHHGNEVISGMVNTVMGDPEKTTIDMHTANAIRELDKVGVADLISGVADLRRSRYLDHAMWSERGSVWAERLTDISRYAMAEVGSEWFWGDIQTTETHEVGNPEPIVEEPAPVEDTMQPEDENRFDSVGDISEPPIKGLDERGLLDEEYLVRGLMDMRPRLPALGMTGFIVTTEGLVVDCLRWVGYQYISLDNWISWGRERWDIACMQILCLRAGIDVGAVDGLAGPSTLRGCEEYAYRVVQGVEPPAIPQRRFNPSFVNVDRSGKWPKQAFNGMDGFYGGVGMHQTKLHLPYTMRLSWDQSTEVDAFSIHEKCHDSALRVFTRILEEYGEAKIKELGFDQFGGCLNVRKMRGGNQYSTHSWGAAIDFDPNRNQLKWKSDQARLAQPDCEVFWRLWEEEGWTSLGRSRDFDWMHVQAADL